MLVYLDNGGTKTAYQIILDLASASSVLNRCFRAKLKAAAFLLHRLPPKPWSVFERLFCGFDVV